MNISIVIPNYNGENLLKNNLPFVIDAISVHKKGFIEVIIVDDNSVDDSVAKAESLANEMNKKYSKIKIKVIKNDKNLGFSSTANRGVSESQGDIVILLNTDVIPAKGFLEPLLEDFKDEKIFAVGCMDISIEQDKIILRGRGIGKWQRGFLIHARGETNKNSTLWVNGGSGAFKKTIWEKLGGFSVLYNPFYWEDIDLSYRAIKSGYKLLFEPKSIVVHEHEKGAINKTYSDFKIKTIAYRNQFIFVWLNATDLEIQLLHIIWLPYHFLRALLRIDLEFFIGFITAFILLPKIIKSRVKFNKYFVKRDSEVITF